MAERFGRYELVSKIAVGGMAEVHRARMIGPSGFEKDVALKVILPHLAEDPAFVSMFIDEAKIVAGLNHPNIVQVFDLGEVQGRYFIAMEYIEGTDLAALMRRVKARGKRLPIPIAVHVAIECLTGLGHAHAATGRDGKLLGLVHRDVSPQNIFIAASGQVKVGDFGIAKAAGRLTQTRAGLVKGKLRYMAPEQIDGKALDARCDLFAVGVGLYEMLAGEVLYDATEEVQLYEQVHNAVVRPFRAEVAIGPGLNAAVHRALERSPAQRWPSARDFAQALRQYLVDHRTPVDAAAVAEFLNTGAEPVPISTPDLQALTEPALPAGPPERMELMSIADTLDVVRASEAPPTPVPAQTAPLLTGSSLLPAEATRPSRRALVLVAAAVGVAVAVAATAWRIAARRPPRSTPSAPSAASSAAPEPAAFDLPPGRGAVSVQTRPAGLLVTIDGRVHLRTPVRRLDLPAGGHRIRIEGPAGSREREFVVVDGEETLLRETF